MKIKNILFLLLFCSAIVAEAQNLSTGTAINKAGRQRMLSQRMAKNYLALGAGVRTEDAMRELDEASSAFNENLRDLEVYSKNKETTDALAFVSILWSNFRTNVLSTPDLESAEKIIVDANNLMNACNVVVDKIVASSGSKTAQLPNICGKQRMFSQKIAMYYIAYSWGVRSKNLEKDLGDAITGFDGGLNTLVAAPENTDEINKILKFQQSEWAFLKKTFNLKEAHSMPANVYSSTNMILKDFDRATTLYEKLINTQP